MVVIGVLVAAVWLLKHVNVMGQVYANVMGQVYAFILFLPVKALRSCYFWSCQRCGGLLKHASVDTVQVLSNIGESELMSWARCMLLTFDRLVCQHTQTRRVCSGQQQQQQQQLQQQQQQREQQHVE